MPKCAYGNFTAFKAPDDGRGYIMLPNKVENLSIIIFNITEYAEEIKY